MTDKRPALSPRRRGHAAQSPRTRCSSASGSIRRWRRGRCRRAGSIPARSRATPRCASWRRRPASPRAGRDHRRRRRSELDYDLPDRSDRQDVEGANIAASARHGSCSASSAPTPTSTSRRRIPSSAPGAGSSPSELPALIVPFKRAALRGGDRGFFRPSCPRLRLANAAARRHDVEDQRGGSYVEVGCPGGCVLVDAGLCQ